MNKLTDQIQAEVNKVVLGRALDRMLEVSIPDEVYEALERQMETEA